MKKDNDHFEIEQQLGEILHPVTPKEDFIPNLQERLKKKAEVVIENPDYFIIVLLIISGFFIGAVIIWLLQILFKKSGSND